MKILLLNLFFISSLYSIACFRIPSHEKNEIPEWFLQFDALERYYNPWFGGQLLKWQLLFSVLPSELQQEIISSLERPDFIDHVYMIKRMYFYKFCGNPRLQKLLVQAIEDRIKSLEESQEKYKKEAMIIIWKELKTSVINKTFFMGTNLILLIEKCKNIRQNKEYN